MRRSRFGKGIALVLVAAVGALSAGCFGKFQLTRKVYDINQSIDEKYVRSAATWVFVIVQVYTVAALLDLIVFNVLEFWTARTRRLRAGDEGVRAWDREDGPLLLPRRFRDGGGDRAVRGERLVSTLRVRDDGRGKVAAVETAEGRVVREVSAVAASDGSVDVTVATAAGEGTERRGAVRPGAGDARGPDRVGSRAGAAPARASRRWGTPAAGNGHGAPRGPPPGRRRPGPGVRGLKHRQESSEAS